MASLNSTNLSYVSAAPSVTEHDTLLTAIEKLRQKALILQNRQRAALEDYEQSEKRMAELKEACDEAESRNQKLIEKIDHYKNQLQEQIASGLEQHQNQLTSVEQELSEYKERNYHLEQNRSRLLQTSMKAENQLQIQLAAVEEESDMASSEKQEVQRKLTDANEKAGKLQVELDQLIETNKQLLAAMQTYVLRKMACSLDESYQKYVEQTIKMKQLTHNSNESLISSDNNEFFTEILLNKFDYGGDWNTELHRPKIEQQVQVNEPTRNLMASVSIFDEHDNETEFNEYVAEDTPILRRRAGSTPYTVKETGENAQRNFEQGERRGKTSKRYKTDVEDSTLSLRNSRTQQQVGMVLNESPINRRRYSDGETQRTPPKTLRTKSRDDILEALRVKISDLLEEKGRLLRRLEAVEKSYMKGRDKDFRVSQIRTEVTRVLRDIKLLKDRMEKINRK